MRGMPNKPTWPFTLNRDCDQADSLISWWPGEPSGGLVLYNKSVVPYLSANLSAFASPFTRASGWTEGKDGGRGALSFDGVDDIVTLSAAQSIYAFFFSEVQAYSMSMWLNPGTQVGAVGFLIGVRRATDFSGWFSYYDKGSSAIYWILQGGGAGALHQRISTASAVPTGVWTQITCTRDTTNTMAGTKIYINGVEDAGTTTDTGTPTAPDYSAAIFGIGRNPQATAFPYLGLIEDVCIWQRALTPAEVKNRYNRDRWALRWQPGKKFFLKETISPALTVPPLIEVLQPRRPQRRTIAI